MRIVLAELTNSSGSSNSNRGGNYRGHGPADLTGRGGNPGHVDKERDGQVWCMQDGRVYEHGDDWDVDSCTSCTCKVSKHTKIYCMHVFRYATYLKRSVIGAGFVELFDILAGDPRWITKFERGTRVGAGGWSVDKKLHHEICRQHELILIKNGQKQSN